MNREEIIKMAREAGIDPHDMCEDQVIAVNSLERFAALLAAHEREQCAKLCETKHFSSPVRAFGAIDCAAAIRARGTN